MVSSFLRELIEEESQAAMPLTVGYGSGQIREILARPELPRVSVAHRHVTVQRSIERSAQPTARGDVLPLTAGNVCIGIGISHGVNHRTHERRITWIKNFPNREVRGVPPFVAIWAQLCHVLVHLFLFGGQRTRRYPKDFSSRQFVTPLVAVAPHPLGEHSSISKFASGLGPSEDPGSEACLSFRKGKPLFSYRSEVVGADDDSAVAA